MWPERAALGDEKPESVFCGVGIGQQGLHSGGENFLGDAGGRGGEAGREKVFWGVGTLKIGVVRTREWGRRTDGKKIFFLERRVEGGVGESFMLGDREAKWVEGRTCGRTIFFCAVWRGGRGKAEEEVSGGQRFFFPTGLEAMAKGRRKGRDGSGGWCGVDELVFSGFSFVCVEEPGKKKGTSGSGWSGVRSKLFNVLIMYINFMYVCI